MEDEQLQFDDLHERHPGLTPSLAGSLYEALCVCLVKYHVPPTTLLVRLDGDDSGCPLCAWSIPDAWLSAAYNNRLDTITMGAYACCLAVVEKYLRMLTVGRALHGSGGDYYVAPLGHGVDENGLPDFDDPYVMRLEVSGTDEQDIAARLVTKVQQLQHASADPAVAGVVGFREATVCIARVPAGVQ